MSYHQGNQAKFRFLHATSAVICAGSLFLGVGASIKSLNYGYRPQFLEVNCSNLTSCVATVGGNVVEGAKDSGSFVLAEGSSWLALSCLTLAAATGVGAYLTRRSMG